MVKGSGAQCAIGKESSWGVAVADTLLLPFTSESFKAQPKKVEEDSLLAAKAAAAYDLMGLAVSGDVSGILKPEAAGFLLKAALGGTDTVAAVTGQQQHTIIAQTASGSLPSYTIFVNRKLATRKYSGMKCASLKLTAKAGDYCRFSATFKGKDEASASITTTTPPSLKAYKMIGATLVAGGTALDITGVELSIDNALDDGVQLNTSGLYNSEPAHGQRKISLTIDMPYDANSESIRATNWLTEALLSTVVLHLESPSIIATTYKYRMDVTLANVAVIEAPVNVGGKDNIMCQLKLEATAVGATEPITAVVYDAQATAY